MFMANRVYFGALLLSAPFLWGEILFAFFLIEDDGALGLG
jgi:hypothetical protein